jgi:hypothetical protein
VIREIGDNGGFFEVHAAWATNEELIAGSRRNPASTRSAGTSPAPPVYLAVTGDG